MCSNNRSYLNVPTELLYQAMHDRDKLYGVLLAILIKTKTASSLYKKQHRSWTRQIMEDFSCSYSTATKMYNSGIKHEYVVKAGNNLKAISLVNTFAKDEEITSKKGIKYQVKVLDRVRVTKPDLDKTFKVNHLINHIREMLLMREIRCQTLIDYKSNYSSIMCKEKSMLQVLTEVSEITASRLSIRQLATVIGLSVGGTVGFIKNILQKGYIKKGDTPGFEILRRVLPNDIPQKGEFLVYSRKYNDHFVCKRNSVKYWISETRTSVFSTGRIILNHAKRIFGKYKVSANNLVNAAGAAFTAASTRHTTREYVNRGLVTSIYEL